MKRIQVKSIEDLREILTRHQDEEIEFVLLLNFGAISRKRIKLTNHGKKFGVHHCIDGTYGEYNDRELNEQTNIPGAIYRGAFFQETE